MHLSHRRRRAPWRWCTRERACACDTECLRGRHDRCGCPAHRSGTPVFRPRKLVPPFISIQLCAYLIKCIHNTIQIAQKRRLLQVWYCTNIRSQSPKSPGYIPWDEQANHRPGTVAEVPERRARCTLTMSGGARSCMLQRAPPAMARPDMG